MKEWVYGRVKDLIESLESGVSVNGNDDVPTTDEPAVLKVSAVTYGIFNPQASKPIRSATELKRAKCNPRAGEIIISRSNAPNMVGASAYITSDYPNRFLADKLWQTIQKKEVSTDMRWLALFLASPWARYRLTSLATGTSSSMKNITKSELMTLPLPIPPLPEQKAIADLLSTWDKAIEKTERLIQAKEKRFKCLLRKLIQEPRNDTKWKKMKLGEACKVITSNVDKKTSPDEIPVRLCNYMDVYKNYYITSSLNFMEASATIKEIEKYQLKLHDVLSTKDSETADDIANSACVLDASVNLLCGYHLAILRPKKQLYGPYLNFALHTPRIRYEFSRQANGATRFGLTMSAYNMVELPFPSLEEQEQIADTLSTAQQEIDLLKQLAEKYKTQKRGLMQKMLTGEWRIKPEIVDQYVEKDHE